MRLFVALDPPADVADTLRGAVDRGRAHTPDLRWAPPSEWHLTLVFLGEVDEERVPVLTDALGREAHAHRPLRLAAHGWGTFPRDRRRASVLWAGLDGDTAALGALADGMRAAAAGTGVPVEHRPYVPHITVARSRPARDLSATAHALGTLRSRRWRAREAHLMESRPGRADRYRTVRTWALGWETDPTPPPERSTS
ncbi:RNA 2',3'-cyclic phosphodiesterase [Nocardiopsis halotolerans]|uniref:RNA 2',3'-cyclic phosphodiesterase n=1 Tax=Nocardiopsis halotolerans TaxID=124252 RepID=UPI0003467E2B|nr:RNA 2',3'-cyclic phosphodiesterase [Nocardiopsis halotolerans]